MITLPVVLEYDAQVLYHSIFPRKTGLKMSESGKDAKVTGLFPFLLSVPRVTDIHHQTSIYAGAPK